MKVLVIGESCKDVFIYGECNRLCPDAPVPVFKHVNSVHTYGMARNVAENLRSLGVVVDVCTNQNHETIIKTRYMDNRTNHMFLRVDENDGLYGVLKNLRKIDFLKYDAIIVSDYNKGYLTEDILKQISLLHPITFIDTKKILGDWIKSYTWIKLNHSEFKNNKHVIDEKIKEKLIVTHGSHGSEHMGKMYPVKNVEVKDTSGAGDTFVAGLCYMFLESKNIGSAIEFANECATKVVQKRGVSVV